MKTIDEAIKHCEEVAEEKESICNVIENKGENWTDSGKNYYDICKKCASEHRQLAEWLRKLKAYESDDEICKCCTHTHNADYCNVCKHNTIFVDYFDLEVTADEASN